jgi:hypothetical protein
MENKAQGFFHKRSAFFAAEETPNETQGNV